MRSDNLSAATHDLRRSRGRALTRRYRELLDHCGLRASLIQIGEAHENGWSSRLTGGPNRYWLTSCCGGSCDFCSVENYQHWLREVVEREHNSKLAEWLLEERRHLWALPAGPTPAYPKISARVRRWSTT